MSRTPEPEPSVSSPFPADPVVLEAPLRRASARIPVSDDRQLVGTVRSMDAAGGAAEALGFLAARPRVVLRPDRAVRRTVEHRNGYGAARAAGAQARKAPLADGTSPLGVALEAAGGYAIEVP